MKDEHPNRSKREWMFLADHVHSNSRFVRSRLEVTTAKTITFRHYSHHVGCIAVGDPQTSYVIPFTGVAARGVGIHGFLRFVLA